MAMLAYFPGGAIADRFSDRKLMTASLVMTGLGEWIEVQATGENAVFRDEQLSEMLRLGRAGIEHLFGVQQRALEQE